jgi:hypothetical protein
MPRPRSPLRGRWTESGSRPIPPDSASILKGAVAFEEKVVIEGTGATREIFSQYGFGPTPPSILSLSPIIYSTTYSADRFGTLKVDGTQTSTNVVSGTMTWTRNDGSVWVYIFTMNRISTSTASTAP